MPIEIRELHINVSVSQPGTGNEQQQQAESSGPEQANPKDMIENVIEQVMKIINDKEER